MGAVRSLMIGIAVLLFGVPMARAQAGAYLFAWAGDPAKVGPDFLAVFDADSASPKYGQVVASVAVPGPTGMPHHTELEMPAGSFLLANAFESGRTFLFDLRDPLHPRIAASFGDLDGYKHPHSYERLRNGHVLATFQYHGGDAPTSDPGGLVEFTENGRLVRSSSAIDHSVGHELIRPYSLAVLPSLDRVVTTNSAMHDADGDGRSVQVWRLSDLQLLRTIVLPSDARHSELNPGEVRVLSDGRTALIHTFSCGLFELDAIQTAKPVARHLYTFDGKQCGVPLRIGHYWLQTLTAAHALAAYDLADRQHIREVSRIQLDSLQKPHWISADRADRRIVLNSGELGDHRLFIVNFDPSSGQLTLDDRFRDPGASRSGVSMDGKTWPHGFTGNAFPHGAVFSRGFGGVATKAGN